MYAKSLLLAALCAVALCAPPVAKPAEEPVPIVSQSADIQPDGTYKWTFESADGTKQEQNGAPKAVEEGVVAEVVQGAVQWTDPEGGQHQLNYVADENGFQPQGADVPVAPEVPKQIARALVWIKEHPQPAEEEVKVKV